MSETPGSPPQARVVFILEDDEDRTVAMRQLLAVQFPQYECAVVDNAPDAIDWLHRNLVSAALICLDHDLGPNRLRDGDVFDPGIGKDVAAYLASQTPICPVIIHSTNSAGAVGMRRLLRGAGWVCSRVIPFNDLEWIETAWRATIRKYLG